MTERSKTITLTATASDQETSGGHRLWRTTILLLAGSALLLGGCRESEQGRVLRHEPGVYLGKADQKLPEAKLDALRDRARGQVVP